MFDDDLSKPKTVAFPRNLEFLSVSDLEEYIDELQVEVQRVKDDIYKKKSSSDAADAFFK